MSRKLFIVAFVLYVKRRQSFFCGWKSRAISLDGRLRYTGSTRIITCIDFDQVCNYPNELEACIRCLNIWIRVQITLKYLNAFRLTFSYDMYFLDMLGYIYTQLRAHQSANLCILVIKVLCIYRLKLEEKKHPKRQVLKVFCFL